LTTLDYSRLVDADTYLIELVTPFVLQSAYPDTTTVPWWWAETRDELRTRTEKSSTSARCINSKRSTTANAPHTSVIALSRRRKTASGE